MKKSTLTILAALVAGSTFATEYHWRGAAPDMTDAGKSGLWNDSSNWTDANGNARTGYPHVAGDKAVFHGTASGGDVQIVANDVIAIDEVHFADGNTLISCDPTATVTAGKMTFADGAGLELVGLNSRPRWTQGYEVPNFKVGNRSELVLDTTTGLMRNAVSHRYQPASVDAAGDDSRGLLIIDENGLLTPVWIKDPNHGTHGLGIGNEVNWATSYPNEPGCLFGCCGNYRGIFFNSDTAKIIVPNGYFMPLCPYDYLGRYDVTNQGQISTDGKPMYYWGWCKYADMGQTSIRAKLNAPELVLAGNSREVIYDDHSTDSVQIYRVVAGMLSLGGTLIISANGQSTTTTTCKMNAATFEIGWNATLDVACANPFDEATVINVKSYNKKSGVYGKINLANSGTVNKLQLDGVDLDAGTYGATGSGAANIRDDIFTGTGVLTVTNGTYVPPEDPPVTETKPLVIYFN